MRRMLLEGLVGRPLTEKPPAADGAALAELAASLARAARPRLGRSLAIREVDAGSCNGCELEIHALNNALYDLERFGLRFVASAPRRRAAGDRPADQEYARSFGAHLSGHTRSEMGR